MKHSSFPFFIGLSLFIVFSGAGCRGEATSSSTRVLKIGAIESLTGAAAYNGTETRYGVEIAQKEMQKKYPNVDIQIFHEDSFFTPKGAVDAYQKLRTSQRIDAVITQASPVALAVQPLAAKDGIVQMTVTASSDAYSKPNDLSFRVSPRSEVENAYMVDFLKKKGVKRVAIVFMNNEAGVAFAKSFKEQLIAKQAGTTIVSEDGFPQETTDFRTVLLKIKKLNPEVVYVSTLAGHMTNIVKQAKELDVRVQFVSFRSMEDPALLKNAGELANGLIYTYGFDVRDPRLEQHSFAQSYRAIYQKEPNGYAAEGYEGTKLLIEALVACESKDAECTQAFYRDLKEYPSVFGPLQFDEQGDVRYPFLLKTVKNVEFVKLEQ